MEKTVLPVQPRRRWWRRLLKWLASAILALLGLLAFLVWAIDTGPGHRFLTDRIAALRPASGLRIRIGRIDGSIWDRATLRDLRLYDNQGLFLEAPEGALDWRPGAWLANRLEIRSLTSDLLILHHLPKLRRTGGPTLPSFDIRIDRLRIDRLILGAAVAGHERSARIAGRANVRRGRALVDLTVRSMAGDRLALLLDAEPDRDRFDLEARMRAPAGGVIGGIIGTKRPIAALVTGKGRWRAWDGKALANVSGRRVIDLALGVRDGRYLLDGRLAPSEIMQGKLHRLTAPSIAVKGEAAFAERRLDGRLSLRSEAMDVQAAGVLDLAESAFEGMRLDARLLRPEALFSNMSGRDIQLTATLDGPFATASYDYAIAVPRFAFGTTGFEGARASGRGRLMGSPFALPVRFTARRVTGVGDVAGGILANLQVDGLLHITARRLTGEAMRLDSDKLKGRLSLLVDLVTGRYDVTVSGGLTRYLIPGLGVVDVTTDLRVVPGPGGRGTSVAGHGRAWVRRLDNGFLRSLAGGLPRIDTRLTRGPDGVLHFAGLVLTGPEIRVTGSGLRRRDGTFQLQGSGRQGRYGDFRIALDGNIARPKVDLLLARPVDALGVTEMALNLDPTPEGFAYRTAGNSYLGPFTGGGRILMPRNAPAVLDIAALDLSGARASGQLRSDPGGFTGALDVAGGGIDGRLLFSPAGDMQRIETHLAVNGATFRAGPNIMVRRGAIDGVVLLDPAGTSIEGRVNAQGLQRGALSLARLAATARLRAGTGAIEATIAGSRGRAFDLKTALQVTPDRLSLTGEGTIDRRPARLVEPAVLTRDGGGWRLAPTRMTYSGGGATLSGRFGEGPNELAASLERMPLSVLDMGYPGLGLSGMASGRLTYAQAGPDGAPTGRADLTVRGLSRAGLVLSSRPVDAAVAAVLNGRGAAARAVVASGGRTIGRAQARLSPLGPGADIVSRLMAAPLFAQLRYGGPADTLWRLTGVETIDLSGPVAVGADMTGTLSDPLIRGSVRSSAARMESAVTGTIVENIRARGRFNGSRLVMDDMAGTTPGGGTVRGRGTFDLSAAHGFGMDLQFDAVNALALNRDDIGATITGPLTIRSDGAGGVIGGDLRLNQARFRLGSAAATAVPRLAVTEINRPVDEAGDMRPAAPWRLDVHAVARSRLDVTGLGLDSEWRADINIRGTATDPAITGRADLMRGGYEFAGRRFDLERGQIRFQGETPPDPVLDIVAQASIRGLSATIHVTGTGQKPDIAFESVPSLPEDELLSRLLFGTSITQLSAPEALQLAAAVSSLRGNGTGLNPINVVRRAAGLDRLRILPADVATGQGTSVAAGKYLNRRTYVELITDGAGYSATRIEFQITRWLSILSSISTIGRQSVNMRVSRDY
ncbi:hypothetical protein CLG96_12210 [Sphingomonas oleivorans]|uniref:Translocation and assembly module TamB C-terminal domain-containing protein n=1 Tax=Sphingomonas oleivorans TaxID=1735121 RepID=A0A2T5FVW1_9SPHN|nr:translocation/assembly module TamB [Sphingomonas oleivorans]PTQ09917.1 hypothetical protein CLG96_12210 [Sphingomonas oleivorans]